MWRHSVSQLLKIFLIFIIMLSFYHLFSYLATVYNFLYNLCACISLSKIEDWGCPQMGWRDQFNVRMDHNVPVFFGEEAEKEEQIVRRAEQILLLSRALMD